MAIRKISDLERLYLKEEMQANHEYQISNMLFEISWPDSEVSKSFISKHTTYQDILENILVDNLLCSDTFVDFYAPITFHDGISVYNGAWISGNFYVNLGINDETLENYETLIRNGKNIIQSIGDGSLVSSAVEGDEPLSSGVTMLCSQYANILSAGFQNVFQSFSNVICSNTHHLATFSDGQILLNSSQLNIRPELCAVIDTDLCVIGPSHFTKRVDFSGNTYFSQVINGCALCAKWADLAEHYSSDADYTPGTLVQFGGENNAEITIATSEANAVITTAPGLVLNGTNDIKTSNFSKAIALVGRTLVRVVGQVKKFDKLVFSETIPGVAKSLTLETTNTKPKKVIGIALESNELSEEKLVLASVQLTF